MAKDPSGITKKADWLKAREADLMLLNDLNNGQAALLEKSETYLPKREYETDEGYAVRLRHTSLRNFLLKLKRVAIATVLRKPIQVENDPSNFTEFVTNDGQSLQLFSRNLLDAAWLEGMALVLTEYPNTDGVETLAEERARGFKPYWQVIKLSQLIEAKSSLSTQMIGGVPVYSAVLSCLRFEAYAETEMGKELVIMSYDLGATSDDDGDRQIVEWSQWAIRKDAKKKEDEGEWVEIDSGVINLPFIPVSPLYIEQEGFFKSALPLLETANLNKHHFMVNSGKFNLLGTLATPLLIFTGVSLDGETITRQPNIGLGLENPQAKASYVSVSPDLLPPMEVALEGLERHLLNGAVQIFEQKNVAETEAAKAMDREQSQSTLTLSAQGLEACLNRALGHAAAYTDATPATVIVDKKFNLREVDPQAFQAWLQGWLSGGYTQETFLHKLEGAGFFDEVKDFNLESELERTQGAAE